VVLMTTLLISDLHLSPERPAVTRAFFTFLENQTADVEALFILGDLFEAWIGDDDPAPLARQVIAALKKLSDSGVRLFFTHGNRDFLIGKQFARESGATLLPDHHLAELGGQRVLLLHGDTLCTGDADYQKFRRKYRHPLVKFLLRHLPLKKRQKMAVEWRQKSMRANANKSDNIMDVSGETVAQLMAQYQVKLMIHGHTHRPYHHHMAFGERLVLGDWHQRGWYIRIEGDHPPELISFPIEES
jgi:UDP-2,3-diacylglucosamine hydrolase